jgi:hypothetical protein
VWPSWRLISAIERINSSAAVAAVVTLVEASFEADTALSARYEVLSDEPKSAVAVAFIAAALSPTVASTASTLAASVALRRASCALMLSRSCSALCCAVMSSCVTTQPPSAIGVLTSDTTRSPVSTIWKVGLPCAREAMRLVIYCSGSEVKAPRLIR